MVEAYHTRRIGFLIANAAGHTMRSFQNVFGNENGMFPTECLESHWTVEECRNFFETQYRERIATFDQSVSNVQGQMQAEKKVYTPPVFYSPPTSMQDGLLQDAITLKLASRHQSFDLADPRYF